MSTLVLSLLFLLLTLVLFYANQAVHRRHPHFLLTPAICTSAILIIIVQATSTPATIAFALPIFQERKLIRKHWLALSLGSCAGIVASVAATLLLDRLMGVHGDMARSLLARSVSTPFALEASRHMGGSAQLTGIFVVMTGLFGLMLGKPLLKLLPLRMRIARGAPYGAAAHGFGLSVARRVGTEEGAVASLTMIFSGVVTVLLAPLLGHLLG